MGTLENMVAMISPYRNIIIDNEIALIGEFENENETHETSKDKLAYISSRNIYELYDTTNYQNNFSKRGDYFRVVDANGCLLFTYRINGIYIIKTKSNQLVGYLFKLKDYKARDEFDRLFETATKQSYIMYNLETKELFTNEILDKITEEEEETPEIKKIAMEIDIQSDTRGKIITEEHKYDLTIAFRLASNMKIGLFIQR